jgi:hypothetical protein
MPPIKTTVKITVVSGMSYAIVAASDGNLGASANASNITVPAAATRIRERAKRPHLRLVRE